MSIFVVGGSGSDTISVFDILDFSLIGRRGNDRLTSAEGDDYLSGGNGRDLLRAGEGEDVLSGGNGRDRLKAGAGDDLLLGGHGNDVLTGGEGADTFWFLIGDGVDRVKDFTPGEDVFAIGPKLGYPLAEDAFAIGKNAIDHNDRVIYNPDTGALFLDRDGSRHADEQMKFAKLGAGLDLHASDFSLFV